MRRTMTLLKRGLLAAAPAMLALGFAAPVTASAETPGPITGQLVDRTDTSKLVSGMVVRLRLVQSDGSPGAVVSEVTTDVNGSFSLTPTGNDSDRYYLRVMPGDYQGNWVVAYDGSYDVVPTVDLTLNEYDYELSAGMYLGKVTDMPAYFTGRVVNSRTHRPVANARVTGRDQDDGFAVEGKDVTGPRGWFRVEGLTCEDSCYLKVNGSAVGYETGFLTFHRIVPTWGEATAATPGPLGDIKLDKL